MPARGSPGRTPESRRTRANLRAVRTGRTYDDIGRDFGVTGSCIRRTAAHWGLPPRIPLPRVTIKCAYCEREVVTTVTAPRKFCSKRCFYRNRRGTSWLRRRDPEAYARWLAARTRTCENCGKQFLAPQPGSDRRFCSYSCSARARPRPKLKHPEALRAALRTGRPRREIAAQFGVTRSYVSLLAKQWRFSPLRKGRRAAKKLRP